MGDKVNLLVRLTRVWVPPYKRITEDGVENVDGYWRDVREYQQPLAEDGYPINHPGRSYPVTYFDSKTCDRCGGSGEHLFNQRDGTVCYGCEGRGRKLTKKGGEGYGIWSAANKAQKQTLGSGLEVGDLVTTNNPKDPYGKRIWARVSDIRMTDQPAGWSGAGEDKKVTAWFMEIDYTVNGEFLKTEKASTAQIFKRKGDPSKLPDISTLPGFVGFNPVGWRIQGYPYTRDG